MSKTGGLLARIHCRSHHRSGNEVAWWAQFGIDPMAIAYQLWTQTHPTPPKPRPVGKSKHPMLMGEDQHAEGPAVDETMKQTQSRAERP